MSNPVVILDLLESEIESRLAPIASAVSQVQVEAAPEDESGYSRPYSRPRISVLAERVTYGDSVDTGVISQPATTVVVVTIQTKKLRGTTGVRYLAQLVKQYLLGFRPSNHEKLTLVDEAHDFDDNIWKTFLAFQTVGHIVETGVLPVLPVLTHVTYQANGQPDWLEVANPDA